MHLSCLIVQMHNNNNVDQCNIKPLDGQGSMSFPVYEKVVIFRPMGGEAVTIMSDRPTFGSMVSFQQKSHMFLVQMSLSLGNHRPVRADGQCWALQEETAHGQPMFSPVRH